LLSTDGFDDDEDFDDDKDFDEEEDELDLEVVEDGEDAEEAASAAFFDRRSRCALTVSSCILDILLS